MISADRLSWVPTSGGDAPEKARPWTPGPWIADDRGVYQADGVGPICWVGDDYPRGDNHPAENMTLISAAPDLYEALERFADDPYQNSEWHLVVGQARAALKKARGE